MNKAEDMHRETCKIPEAVQQRRLHCCGKDAEFRFAYPMKFSDSVSQVHSK